MFLDFVRHSPSTVIESVLESKWQYNQILNYTALVLLRPESKHDSRCIFIGEQKYKYSWPLYANSLSTNLLI